jgi:hypothetical protein
LCGGFGVGETKIVTKRDEDSFDFLTGREADFMKSVINELADTPWAKPLVDDINATGGLTGDNKAKLFELRFGHSLHKAGILPRYETAGQGQSTLDYGFTSGGRDFLVEMMRLEETDAVRATTTTEKFADGAVMVGRHLSTDAEDPRQSEEGETLKAVERICQKFESGGKPHKFPAPGSATHVLLVDFRTFLNGGDERDCVHVGLGGELVLSEAHRRYWKGNLITGVFSPRTKLRDAAEARERLHFIGFVNEKSYETGAFGRAIQFIANPHLFKTSDEARAALAGWPLGEPNILNARAAKAAGHLLKLVDEISNLTVSESTNLSKMLQDKWRIPSSNAGRKGP